MKRLFTLLLAVLMLFSLTACNTNEPAATTPTTEPTTEPTQPEVSQIISQVQWVVNDPFDMKDKWDCQYDAMSNTLVITGEVYDTREIVFFEGCKQIQKETCLDEEGMIRSQKEYDEQGNLIYELDDYGYRRVYEYNGSLLVQETAYDEGDQPSSVKTWSYNDAGLEVAYAEKADEGQATHQETWVYDSDGNLIDHRWDSTYDDNAWYQYETFVYKDGLMVESTHEGDDPANAWDYSVVYGYDDRGRMVSALRKDDCYGEAEDTWEYDNEGRVIKSVEHYNMDGWVTVTNEYEYDADGHLIREYYQEVYLPDNELFSWDEVLYTYDSDGQLTQKKSTSINETEYRNNYGYDGQGNRTLYSLQVDGEEQYLLICDYDSKGNRIRVDRNGETELTGDDILFLTNENDVEFYMAVQYKEAEASTEAAAVNDFILQYIQNNY